MLPIVIRSTEEMLQLVPDDLRQASDALGARRWRTTVTVVIPAALPGIVSGAMLAVARAAGETAPLLFTIGASRRVELRTRSRARTPRFRWRSGTTRSSRSRPRIDRAWGAAFTLIVIVFVCTVIARIVSSRFATTSQ